MDIMKHVYLCLILAMKSYKSTNNNVLTNMPVEVVQQVLTFLHGRQARHFCNLLGMAVKHLASFQ